MTSQQSEEKKIMLLRVKNNFKEAWIAFYEAEKEQKHFDSDNHFPMGNDTERSKERYIQDNHNKTRLDLHNTAKELLKIISGNEFDELCDVLNKEHPLPTDIYF